MSQFAILILMPTINIAIRSRPNQPPILILFALTYPQLVPYCIKRPATSTKSQLELKRIIQSIIYFMIMPNCSIQARQFKRMNKSARMDLTLSKPSSKDLAKIKDKLRSQEQKLRQYESMCETEEGKLSHSIIPHKRASKKDLRHPHSPARLTRSKSKTLDRSIKKHSEDKPEKKAAIGELYSELMAVKSEYNTLKQSYNRLVVEKKEMTSRQQNEKEAIQFQLQMRGKELQKYQRMAQGYEQQIERIKKECYKLLENQKLKNKKLEQTIQEKDLMIAYLRNEAQKRGESTLSTINQSFLPNYSHLSQVTLHSSLMSNVIVEEISLPPRARAEEDSLSFSRDKSKEMESIQSFLTAQDQSIHLNMATRKDIVIVDTHSSATETENDQCLTFEHRDDEECEEGNRPLKGSVISEKGKKSSHKLPPKNLGKIKCVDLHKRERLQTDENSNCQMNKKQLIQSKKLTNSSLSSRKKNSSRKKKV